MTQIDVHDDGRWSVTWPELTAGPFESFIEYADGMRRGAGNGAWTVTPDAAHWTGDLAIDIELRDNVAIASVAGPAPSAVARIVVAHGARPLPDATAQLVEGYDSWSWAGVRAGDVPTRSFWRAADVSHTMAFGVQALDTARWCTAIERDTTLTVACGGTPRVQQAPGSWGYEVGPLQPASTASDTVRSEPIALGAGNDALGLLAQLADLAGTHMRARHWSGPAIRGWESWYYYGPLAVSPDDVLRNARALRALYRDQPGFDLVQLDDGWQRTYGAWTPNERFPSDLRVLTDDLHAQGCRAGLWLAPFMVQPHAFGLTEHLNDWCIRTHDDTPLADRFERWALDASNPAVIDWMRDLGAQVRAWGFEMVKLDFLYLGAQEGTRHDPRVTGTESLRRGLQAFVDGVGDDVYVLGCGMPLQPAVGICHGNRVGHDLCMPVLLQEFANPLDDGWTGFHGIRPQARNVAARFALQGRWFDCDPDVVMAWGSDGVSPGGYSLDESRTLAALAAVTGGPFFLADDLDVLRPEERAVLEDPEILALLDAGPFRPVDLFEHIDEPTVEQMFTQPTDLASTWASDRATVRFNWTDHEVDGVAAHGVRITPSRSDSEE